MAVGAAEGDGFMIDPRIIPIRGHFQVGMDRNNKHCEVR